MKSVFNFLWQAIKGYRRYYLLMLIAPLCGAFYKPIVYYAIKLMVDTIVSAKNLTFSQLLTPLVIYLVADILMSSVWRISQIALWKSEPYVQQGIITSAMQKILSYRYTFFQNTPSGSVVSKVKGLLDGYGELWSQLYYGISYWLLASITTAASIFWVSYKLGLIILSWSLIFLVLNYFLAKKINRLSQEQNTAKHAVMGEVADTIGNIQSIKLFATRHYEQQRLADKIANEATPKKIKLYKFEFKVSLLNDALGIFIIVTMLLVMIKLKTSNQVSVGDFVFVFGMVFQFQENLFHFMQEFQKLSDRMGDLKSSLTIQDADKSEYLDQSQLIQDKLSIAQHSPRKDAASNLFASALKSPLSIEFKNIIFKYPDNKQIFSNLNLHIKAGEKIGIVGYTGAGKTTLINLLLKIFIPNSGQVLINNQDIALVDSDVLRKLISIIPQDISLFHRNLSDNIRYGKIDATAAEVQAASEQAHADEFINKLPDGYATMVGERGIKLSGGQRQRIAIARAILKNAPILILDEATSSLDSVTEQYIQASIKELLVGKTVLAIAHRLSTLQNMDRLIVISNGAIVESGTHEQLLAMENSLYAKIWHTQYASQ
jgi:ATP-binding cassette subfamily B protein